MRTTAIRGTAAAVLFSATVLGLAACVNAEQSAPPGAGSSVSYGNPPSGPPTQVDNQHNQADVTFLNQVVLLRQQTVQLAYLGVQRSTNDKVKSLATKITQGQQPPVDTLIAWLRQWGQSAPSSSSPSASQVPGFLSQSQLQQLSSAQGATFDHQWAQNLTGIDQALLKAAQTEQAQGLNGQVKQVAQQLAGNVQSELSQLGSLS